jgi:hypothetical protein
MVFLQLAAFIQTISETIYHYINQFCGTSKDMVLLHNGHWLDTSIRVSQFDIRCVYNAANHTIMLVDEPGQRTTRWPWLSVVTRDGVDISEFFSSLRIGADVRLFQLDVLMLYAHQRGILHLRGLEVMGRDGAPIII